MRRRIRRKTGQQPTVLHHILVVFRQGGAKKMPSLGVGHEIKVIRLRRLERSAQRSFPGISNWPGRKPAMLICVVRRIETEVLPR